MIRNASQGSQFADTKSILSLLILGVEQGHEIELAIHGENEAGAASALKALIEIDFEGYLYRNPIYSTFWLWKM